MVYPSHNSCCWRDAKQWPKLEVITGVLALAPAVSPHINHLGSLGLSLRLICDIKELDDFINNQAFSALTFQESISLMRIWIPPPLLQHMEFIYSMYCGKRQCSLPNDVAQCRSCKWTWAKGREKCTSWPLGNREELAKRWTGKHFFSYCCSNIFSFDVFFSHRLSQGTNL